MSSSPALEDATAFDFEATCCRVCGGTERFASLRSSRAASLLVAACADRGRARTKAKRLSAGRSDHRECRGGGSDVDGTTGSRQCSQLCRPVVDRSDYCRLARNLNPLDDSVAVHAISHALPMGPARSASESPTPP